MRLAHTASRLGTKARATLIGTCAVLVALIATAFAVGGSDSGSAGASTSTASAPLVAPGGPDFSYDAGGGKVAAELVPAPQNAVGVAADTPPLTSVGSPAGHSAAGSSARSSAAEASASDSSLDATKIVRTGSLTVRVAKSRVQEVVAQLSTLATAQGGYVSSSQSNLGSGDPYGEVVLRVPVGHFDSVIAAAQRLGHTLSLSTSADDVTGHYVDLNARLHALERTRSTYLSILSRAHTIGATLAVQQRIDDVQQQIDQLQGQVKVLSKQASYSTLTVDVTPQGFTALTVHHKRDGIGKAWHDSWSRFGHGVNSIVGAIGPIVFAILLIGLLAGIGTLGYRGVRRLTS